MIGAADWSLFWRSAKSCWVLKYKSVDGWAQKHLPKEITREDGPRKRKPGARQVQLPLTRAEVWAAEWLANAETLKLRPRARAGGLALRDAAEQWKTIRTADDALTSPATLRRFSSDLRNILAPFKDDRETRSLGDEDVVSLATDLALLRRWFRSIVARLSPWRARSAFSTLRSFFDDAIVEKWVRGVNPMKNEALVRELPPLPNKADRGGILLFELATMQSLLLHPHVPLGRATRYVVAATLGKREGEIAGCSWGDVHLDAPIPNLDVVRARRLVRKKGEVRGPLKTPSSRGVLPLHPAAVAALREWRDDVEGGVALLLGRLPRPDDPVFPSEHPRFRGAFTRPRSAEKLRADLEAAELSPTDAKGRPLTMHTCRKSFATWLRRAGVPEHIRKALMRHGANDVTEDFYTEELPEMAEAVARIALKWAVVPRVVPTLVPSGTKVDRKLNHIAEPRVGLEPTTCALRKRPSDAELGAEEPPSTAKVRPAPPKDSAPREDSAREVSPGSVPGTKAAELVLDEVRGVLYDPRNPDRSPSRTGPGVVPAGASRVRLEVGGEVLAATDVRPGEPVADVEARLKLAVGQRGGLR